MVQLEMVKEPKIQLIPEGTAMMAEEQVPEVLMLGEKRRRAGKLGEGLHPGRYELVELFSAPRVVKTASGNGIRGGWALDIHHQDPVTGSEWDLADPAAQAKVWKMLRRDKPLVVGMSFECTLFSSLQNLRKMIFQRKIKPGFGMCEVLQ